MYTEQQLTAAFSRVGLEFSPECRPTRALAERLQYAFQTHIPYENLDILRGIPLSLDYGALYEKIVTRRRGGYCFELNGFLGEVFRSLGYGVTEYMARYLRGETEIPVRRHRVVVIRAEDCEDPLICDAGIGQAAFRFPLRMREGYEDARCGETYRVDREDFFGWVISDRHRGAWRRFYSFTEEVQLNIDYGMPSFWCEHAPESPFIRQEMLSLKTPAGRKTLDGAVYREFDGDAVTETVLTEEEKFRVIREVFGIEE